MKVAIACFNLQWQAGGTRLIFSLAHALAGHGNEVVIYVPQFNSEAFPELSQGLSIVVVPPPYPFDWTSSPQGFFKRLMHKYRQERLHSIYARILAKEIGNVDVINAHDFAYKIGRFAKRLNPLVRVIWTQNDPPFLYLPKDNFIYDLLSRGYNLLKRALERPYFSSIDQSVVLDHYNGAWAAERGIPSSTVRSGVDFEEFYAPARKISTRRLRILGFGALNKYRRFEDLIEAAALFRRAGYDPQLTIICKDIWNQGEYREFLKRRVRELDAEAFTTLHFDGVSKQKLRETYHANDVFVLPVYLPPPRNGYGWGLSNFEAMAAGLPLIICRTSTATEVLTDGENALFVDPCSPVQIAEKLRFLCDHPDQALAIAERGQRYVHENISWEKYAREMEKVFSVSL